MTGPNFLNIFGQRVAIWIVYFVAGSICAVTMLGMFQLLIKTYSFDTAFLSSFAWNVCVFVSAAMLIEGVRRKLRWSIWPALILFISIVPVNVVSLAQYTLNPNIPVAGFATEEDLAARGTSPLKAIIKPTATEFWSNRTKTIISTLLVLIFVAIPTPILWRLRNKGVLQ